MAQGYFVNKNAGDVEKSLKFLNHVLGNPDSNPIINATAPADGAVGSVGVGESLNESKQDELNFKN